MTTGTVSRARVSEAHRIPRAESGRGQGFGKEDSVDASADEVDEEAQAEHAEHDGRDARQVVHGDAHRAHERALPGVLTEVEGREHAEGHDDDAHEEDHHHRPEDGGEDPALGVRLAGVAAEELPQAAGIDSEASEGGELVGGVGAVDVEGTQVLIASFGGAKGNVGGARLLHEGGQLLGLPLEERLLLGRDPLHFCAVPREIAAGIVAGDEFEAAFFEAGLLDPEVDGADLALFDRRHRVAVGLGLLHQGREGRAHGGSLGGHRLLALLDRHRHCEKGAVLAPLHEVDVLRPLALRDLVLVEPLEIEPVEIAVSQAEEDAVPLQMVGVPGIRYGLPVRQLSQEHAPVLERDLLQGLGPEEGETVGEDHEDEAADHEDADPEGAPREPDQRVPALPRPGQSTHQIARYRSRRRCRTTSARVLTKNVIRKRTSPARNSVRYRVPP